jgi:hypothetical protein
VAGRIITVLLVMAAFLGATGMVIAQGGGGGAGSASDSQYGSPCPDNQIAVDGYCCPPMHAGGTFGALDKDPASKTGAFCVYADAKGHHHTEAETQAHLQKDVKKSGSGT